MLNEVKAGLVRKLPPKPVPMILYEQCKELGIPLLAGGIMDQPHIWLMQYAVCMQREIVWSAINQHAKPDQP